MNHSKTESYDQMKTEFEAKIQRHSHLAVVITVLLGIFQIGWVAVTKEGFGSLLVYFGVVFIGLNDHIKENRIRWMMRVLSMSCLVGGIWLTFF